MLVYLNPIEYKNRRSCCFNSCNALFSTLMAFSGLLLIYLHLQKRLRYLKMIFLQRPKGKEGRLLAWFTFSPWSLRRETFPGGVGLGHRVLYPRAGRAGGRRIARAAACCEAACILVPSSRCTRGSSCPHAHPSPGGTRVPFLTLLSKCQAVVPRVLLAWPMHTDLRFVPAGSHRCASFVPSADAFYDASCFRG